MNRFPVFPKAAMLASADFNPGVAIQDFRDACLDLGAWELQGLNMSAHIGGEEYRISRFYVGNNIVATSNHGSGEIIRVKLNMGNSWPTFLWCADGWLSERSLIDSPGAQRQIVMRSCWDILQLERWNKKQGSSRGFSCL